MNEWMNDERTIVFGKIFKFLSLDKIRFFISSKEKSR